MADNQAVQATESASRIFKGATGDTLNMLDTLAKALKRRGFVFVGPTTAYATMQAAGVVNDHLAGCVAREQVR